MLILAALPFGLGAAPTADPASARRVLRAGVETHSEPFTYADDKGRPAGFSVELLQAVAKTEGLEIDYQVRDWAVLLEEFKQGRIDVICNIVDTPERLDFMRFSTTTMLMRGALFVHRDAPPIDSTADLAGRRLAVPKDSRAHLYALRQGWKVEFVFGTDIKECVRAVQEGRADVVLAVRLVAEHLIKADHYDKVVASGLAFPDFEYREHFAVRKEDDLLLARLNEGLFAVKTSGVYDRLYEKWLGPLEPKALHWRDLQPYLPLLTVLALVTLGIFVWQRRLLLQVSRQAREIRANEERLQLVFEGSQDGFWDWNVATGHILRSPRWAGMLGYTLGEIGRDRQFFTERMHPEDLPRVQADVKLMEEGRDHYMHEFRLRAKTGEWKWILDRGKVVARDPVTGQPLRITGTHTDITARKVAEEAADKLGQKMQETQKLESLGVLAGGIAHDFNNLLSVVLGNASLARLEAAETTANTARLDSIITAAHRAAELCRQLLAYAGKGNFSIARLNLNQLITETTHLLELSISKQARLEFALTPALPTIEADPSQLRQIVMNLVINASEALGDHTAGVIRLVTTVVTLPLPGPENTGPVAELAPGTYVCMEVSDTGAGMPPDVVAKIFDPFFSTKFTGRGLGLAAVLGIVRTHHGALRVYSTPGKGSTFRIYLPVSQTQTAHPFAAPADRAI